MEVRSVVPAGNGGGKCGKERTNADFVRSRATVSSTTSKFENNENPFIELTAMASDEYNLRLKFLQNSANFLSSESNSTAAHLMVQHNHLLHEESKPIKTRQHESWCCACGSPRQPSYTKIVKPKQKLGKGKSRSSLKDASSNGVIVYKCLRCSRRDVLDRRTQNQQPSKASAISTSISTNTSNLKPSTPNIPATSSTDMSSAAGGSVRTTLENASSKKRAKARKQGGLQALLASKQHSQESKPPGSSLDLLDFLQ